MNKFVSWLCKIFLKPIVGNLFVKEVRGLENIPGKNFILVSNHTSYLDIIIDAYLCVPRRFHFIGQIDGWKGVMGWLVRTLYFFSGVIPLDRKSAESRENTLDEAIKVLKKGNILVIYPEGARSQTGGIGEGKLGTAKIFLKTGVPILPVALWGTFDLLPPKGKLKIKRIVKVNIGSPLYFQEELGKSRNLDENSGEYQDILQRITGGTMEEINKLFAEL